ncbi:unnamed protein product [Hapterophycus canaliculatus]
MAAIQRAQTTTTSAGEVLRSIPDKISAGRRAEVTRRERDSLIPTAGTGAGRVRLKCSSEQRSSDTRRPCVKSTVCGCEREWTILQQHAGRSKSLLVGISPMQGLEAMREIDGHELHIRLF